MQLRDLERVNHLVGELDDLKTLIGLAERAEPAGYQVFIEAPGDASLKMSAEGATTSHSRGLAVSAGFLADVKRFAIAELRTRQQAILNELRTLGVETGTAQPG